jgi:hypothetical protein
VLSLLDPPPVPGGGDGFGDSFGGSGGGGGSGHNAGMGSLTAMRLLHYHKVSALPEKDAQAKLGEHTDSSLVTVAPRSTARGLEAGAYTRSASSST